VSKQRVLANREPQVLAAPADFPDLPVSKRGGEVSRTSEMTPGRARMKDLDVTEGAPGHVLLETSPDTLHLWKLWHRRPLKVSVEPGFRYARPTPSVRSAAECPSARLSRPAALRPSLIAVQASSAACCSASFLDRPSPSP